jgi:hypothetical protein
MAVPVSYARRVDGARFVALRPRRPRRGSGRASLLLALVILLALSFYAVYRWATDRKE